MNAYRSIVACIGWISLCLLSACQPVPDKPTRIVTCAPMPVRRVSAAGVAWNGKGYVLGGRDEQNRIQNNIYCYDPATDSWSFAGTMPCKGRVNAAAAMVEGVVYWGLGFQGKVYQDTAYLTDWWKWDIATGRWDSLARFPSKNTVAPLVFTQGNHIYCMNGFGNGYSSELWDYDIATNRWHAVSRPADIEKLRTAACGTVAVGKCYYGSGHDSHTLKDWMRVFPDGSVSPLRTMPDRGRCMAACAADEHTIWVIGGRYFAGPQTGGEVMRSILAYDIASDTWSRAGETPDAGESRTALSIGGYIYVGLGNTDEVVALNTWYRIEP